MIFIIKMFADIQNNIFQEFIADNCILERYIRKKLTKI